MRSSLRLFIALWPADPVRSAIAGWQAEWAWPQRAGVVPPDQLHLTLHFLGDVAPERLADLRYVLKTIPMPHISLHFGRPDIWPHGIAVLRPDHAPTVLRGLHARIGLALAGIELRPEEQPFRPHVTLARRAGGAKPPPGVADVHWEANSGFALVQSLGGTRGYQILERFGA